MYKESLIHDLPILNSSNYTSWMINVRDLRKNHLVC